MFIAIYEPANNCRQYSVSTTGVIKGLGSGKGAGSHSRNTIDNYIEFGEAARNNHYFLGIK